MSWQEKYKDKVLTLRDAAKQIHSGQRIVVGHACGEPSLLLAEVTARKNELRDVEIVHMVAMGEAPYAKSGMEQSFRHNALFVGKTTREAVAQHRADYTPCFFSEVPRLFKDRILPVDVVLLQVTPPDENGACSYGVSADYTVSAAENAALVIAQVNTKLPHTNGAKIFVDQIDFLVEGDQDVIELTLPKITDVERRIGQQIAQKVANGATLQLGIGAIPDAVLLFLKDKKDLGIHSEMFSDGVVELAEAGVITNRKKTINTGKFVATFLMGSQKLYHFIDHNPDVELLPVDYVNDPFVIAQHDNMVSINSALQVDLMGQVNAEMIGNKQFSGIGGQIDFIRGTSRSKNGISIIALPSTAAKGSISRISCLLDQGAAVSTSREDVQYIVTEYGLADMRGKSIEQRARALIEIAHPDFRKSLYAEAEQNGIL